MNPRRYQPPSRCGSPSFAAPEPLMGVKKKETRKDLPSYDPSLTQNTDSNSSYYRLNRHDLPRSRDLTLLHEPHPSILYDHPQLSIHLRLGPTHQNHPKDKNSCQPMIREQPSTSSQKILDDRILSTCTKYGKHICQLEEELEEIIPNLSSNSS